jgi:glucan phosphoethanolaminetransferase (alkaline phosphatase superfamily)
MKLKNIDLFGLPLPLLAFALFWLLSSLVWHAFDLSWNDLILFPSALIAACLVVFNRSFSVALACASVVILVYSSIVFLAATAEAPVEIQVLTILAGISDFLAMIALWLSWKEGHIHPSKVDWMAAIATIFIIFGISVIGYLLSILVPVRLEVFGLVILMIGAGVFVWLKRMFQKGSSKDGETPDDMMVRIFPSQK